MVNKPVKCLQLLGLPYSRISIILCLSLIFWSSCVMWSRVSKPLFRTLCRKGFDGQIRFVLKIQICINIKKSLCIFYYPVVMKSILF